MKKKSSQRYVNNSNGIGNVGGMWFQECRDAVPADTTAESAVSGDETSADTQAADAETTDASKTDGTFTVGFDQDFPPMGFVGDDGESLPGLTWRWQQKLQNV